MVEQYFFCQKKDQYYNNGTIKPMMILDYPYFLLYIICIFYYLYLFIIIKT